MPTDIFIDRPGETKPGPPRKTLLRGGVRRQRNKPYTQLWNWFARWKDHKGRTNATKGPGFRTERHAEYAFWHYLSFGRSKLWKRRTLALATGPGSEHFTKEVLAKIIKTRMGEPMPEPDLDVQAINGFAGPEMVFDENAEEEPEGGDY